MTKTKEETLLEMAGLEGAMPDELTIHPDDFVGLGGELPPNRPEGPALIYKRAGQPAEWIVPTTRIERHIAGMP